MRIVFMGTPEFAVPSLKILHESDFEVVGVITSTDKYGGRGRKKLLESAVKKYALAHNIPILQPKNLKSSDFLKKLEEWKADIQFVVAFRMLPIVVWDMPKLGTINLHGSLLPKYRGAAPINWAVMNGEKETGVTTFKLKHEIDTGNIILQDKIEINPNDTAGDVHDKMMFIGAETVLKTMQLIADNKETYTEQDASLICKAPKIYHETCQIDFSQSAQEVHNHIRGLSPFPCAWTTIDGLQFNIIRSIVAQEVIQSKKGQILIENNKRMFIQCKDHSIEVLECQLSGKKRMAVRDLLNGFKLKEMIVQEIAYYQD